MSAKIVRYVPALHNPCPRLRFLFGPPYYGVEFRAFGRVIWLGYTAREWRSRGW